MNGEVIKSFLVGLGFGVDEASLAKFNKSIAAATLKVTALYASIKVAASGIAFGISKISESFEQLGYEYKIIAPAINKAIMLRREMFKAYSAAGINLVKVVQASVRLNLSITKTKYALEAIYKSTASRFFELLTKQSDVFRKKLYENMPKIINTVESFVKIIFRAFEVTTLLGARLWSILGRIYDFFVILDNKTAGWSTIILGAVAAWKLLNLSFLATPLGLLIAGLTALLALWDDFKTFKEGGQSLINWGSETTKIMMGLAAAIGSVAAAVGVVILAMKAYAAVQAIVNGVMLLNPFGLILAGITALIAGLTYLDAKWKIFGGHLSDFFSGIGGRIMDFVSGGSAVANATAFQGGPGGVPKASPVGGAVQNSQTRQNVNAETNINVVGSADAAAVGKAVAGEQNKVNFNLVRNMKGATPAR